MLLQPTKLKLTPQR